MKGLPKDIFSIREGSDFEKAKSSISNGVSIRGYNLWILLCAALLASLGLDTNSTAVIIGAMLISPLMSPILGVGLALAIHERKLLLRSLRNLGIAVFISLCASIIYFLISPLGDITPELQGRTYPTLLDVGVALFGGIAGIISITRQQQTNAIPGVAIATALMPPLCTAGFGIATAHWNYFFGAFYLFFINAVFISLATFLIVRYLHFPEKAFSDTKAARQYRTWFILLSFGALIPSIYFLYTVYKEGLIKQDINTLVISPIEKRGNEILKWETYKKDSSVYIKVYHSGMQLGDSLRNAIDSALHAHHMKHYQLVSMRVNLTKEEVSELSAEMTKQMFQEMHLDEIRQPDTVLLQKNTLPIVSIYKEVKIAFPFVDSIFTGWMIYAGTNGMDTIPSVMYTTQKRAGNVQVKQLYRYLLERFSRDTIVLIRK